MNIEEFFKGWLVGDFEPNLIRSTDIEVGLKYYEKGDYEATHVHKVAVEFTIVVEGKVRMLGSEWNKGDIIRVDPKVSTDFKVLSEKAITLVIKSPSCTNDKYIL